VGAFKSPRSSITLINLAHEVSRTEERALKPELSSPRPRPHSKKTYPLLAVCATVVPGTLEYLIGHCGLFFLSTVLVPGVSSATDLLLNRHFSHTPVIRTGPKATYNNPLGCFACEANNNNCLAGLKTVAVLKHLPTNAHRTKERATY
jgi:hypothetical protein